MKKYKFNKEEDAKFMQDDKERGEGVAMQNKKRYNTAKSLMIMQKSSRKTEYKSKIHKEQMRAAPAAREVRK